MRLLDTETGQFVDKDPEDEETVYAILSHTWSTDGEQTYEQLKKVQRRYSSKSQTPQSSPRFAETDGTASPKLVRGLPTALGRLTESEVEALLRLVAETFGLTLPAPAPSPNNSSVPALDPHLPEPLPQSIWDDPEMSPKIRDACRVARENGYRYIWIDSCCIDKSSSSELSQAINSMYKWYGRAAVCYAYLTDVPPGEDHQAKDSHFRKSRWFKRGWTLQELIAPISVEFLSKDWAPIGSKHTLANLVETVTNINYKALWNLEPLNKFSVAQRLSWAANRETTRMEDKAYSLLGIFDINMPTLYGEGDRAFRRLQEHIMQRTPDQTLFAWGRVDLPSTRLPQNPNFHDTPNIPQAEAWIFPPRRRLFATSPDSFSGCEGISDCRRDPDQLLSSRGPKISYTPTPYGISTQFQMTPLTRDLLQRALPIPHILSEDFQLSFSSLPLEVRGSRKWYLAILQCQHEEFKDHLLGRVCYVAPSEEPDIEFVFTGVIGINSPPDDQYTLHDLVLLSPHTVEYCRPYTELKTVYIPHPDRTGLLSRHHNQPYATVKFVLSPEAHDALRSRGHSVNLRNPDLGQPTTHRLTLSKPEHTYVITIEFQHTLDDSGKRLTIDTEVRVSDPESSVRLDSTPGSDQEDTASDRVSWSDTIPWEAELDHKSVTLGAVGVGTLTVGLRLAFAGQGVYALSMVDILCDVAPPPRPVSSADEPAVVNHAAKETEEET
ncbi:hypothetical protein GSI_08740 [Ganoderma sinense ZZ0214-1]|uniref:Uncharacterized protein n=1 Tax=Ganoderma sinense ZZ0214-1 TaxID=1077348 RepID=A0A2G8S4J2_9APHY|nr:hypothetical protein GSI_08740 [Ganoderma sinense ZZ0214-1]